MSVKKTTLHPDGDFSVDLYPKTSYDQVDGIYNVYMSGSDQAIEYRLVPESQGISEHVETYINVESQVWNDVISNVDSHVWADVISNSHIELDGDVAITWDRWQDYNYIQIENYETREFVQVRSDGVIIYDHDRSTIEVPIRNIKLKENYRLIETITLTEPVHEVIREKEPDGKKYNFKEIFIRTLAQLGDKSGSNPMRFMINGSYLGNVNPAVRPDYTCASCATFRIEKVQGLSAPYFCFCEISSHGSAFSNAGAINRNAGATSYQGTIVRVHMYSLANEAAFPVGTVIEIFAKE